MSEVGFALLIFTAIISFYAGKRCAEADLIVARVETAHAREVASRMSATLQEFTASVRISIKTLRGQIDGSTFGEKTVTQVETDLQKLENIKWG